MVRCKLDKNNIINSLFTLLVCHFMRLRFKNNKIITCTECSSMRLFMIGDVLECVDCGNCRALG